MIKLDSLDSGGKQIIYRHTVSGGTWDYGSFEEIVTDNAAPPSKVFPLTDAAAGGIFDHAFVFSEFGLSGYSTSNLKIGAGSSFWAAVNGFIGELTGSLTVTKIYISLTEIDYTGLNQSNFKSYCHIGFDVYVKV